MKKNFADACLVSSKSLATQRAYWGWAVRFVKHSKAKSADELCLNPQAKFAAFINSEARRGVSAATQNQAFNALVFLYERVLGETLGPLPEMERAKRPARLPGVPATHADTMRLVSSIGGKVGLALRLTYGCALRISETLRLRLRDLDFSRGEIRIHGGKGDKDGVVGLPAVLADELLALVQRRETQHQQDTHTSMGWVHLPGLYGTKHPAAHLATEWQYLFAASGVSTDPATGKKGRHHITPAACQLAMRKACQRLKLKVKVSPHGLRHAGAREMERRGSPVSEIQKCLRHKDVHTTMRYLGQGTGGKPKVVGPLD